MKKIPQHIFLFLVAVCLVTGCKKSEYLTDEGVHSAITPLSNYDYLKQHSWNSFDSLLMVIDHFGLKEEVNKANTFFAPTNYSVSRLYKFYKDQRDENVPFTIDTLCKFLTADSVRQYLFNAKVILNETPLVPTLITKETNPAFAAQRFLQTAAEYYLWGSKPVYSLYLIKVRGDIDDPNTTPVPNDPNNDTRVLCQTTGILTSNGATVMHVLANTHVFVRF